MKLFQFLLIAFIFHIVSCKKENFITSSNARLNTSADTIAFDTVFTSVGSVTQFFKIFNGNDQKLKLSQVRLAGGANSSFRINVDGFTGPVVNDIELASNDSVYVFVTVKIDPTVADLAFVIQDSIEIIYNGNTKWVQLEAWGQNANFLRARVIAGNETWTNAKPYVILDGLFIAPGATLTINKGTNVFVHADAPIIVDGTLKVFGEKYDSTRVVFRGDRLDQPYRNFPAAWPGIFFRESSANSELNFAIIRNAYQGIVLFGPKVTINPKLSMNETVIDNCYDAGLLAIQSDLKTRNSLISNCGRNLVLANGGNYDVNHLTAVSVSNNFVPHKEPVLFLSNFIQDGNTTTSNALSAIFKNCIFWGENGTNEDEVLVSKQGSGSLSITFQNCLWKSTKDPIQIAGVSGSNNIVNQAPQFDSINTQRNYFSFRLKPGSSGINAGILTGVNIDLDGATRPVGIPDIGAYETR